MAADKTQATANTSNTYTIDSTAQAERVTPVDATGTAISPATALNQTTLIGAVNETAPATDTAPSGLNGREQRIAQRLTSVIALLPAALSSGGGVKAGIVDALPAGNNNIGDVDVASIAAGETHVGQVGGHTAIPSVIFSLDTSAYASGDLLADTQAVTSVFRVTDGTGVLASITLNDKDDQGVALYIVILDANVTLGTENAAPSISDANADSILGIIAVATTDWLDLGGCKVANIRGINLPIKAASGTTSLYIGLVNSTGTPTFTASGVTARLGVLQD